MIGRVINFLFFFLYISNIQFVILPDKLRTRLIVSAIGFIYFLLRFKANDSYRILNVIKLIIPLAVWMSITIIANMSGQYWFLQYVAMQILFMFGAFFVIHTGRIDKLTTLLWYFVIYVGIQDTIAMVSYQMPQVSMFIRSIQVSGISDDRANLLALRTGGIGEFSLFGGGMWVAMGLLCMTMLYKLKKLTFPIYIGLFMTLLITGLFIARTSLTGLLSVIILFFPFRKNWKKISLWVAFGAVFLLLISYSEKFFESKGMDTSYAFESFDKYRETGQVQSNSVDITRDMWNTLPTTWETWIAGDAKYEDESGHYYMHVDVGYLRVLFFGGLIGLFFYLFYIFSLVKVTYERSGKDINMKYFVYTYYVMVLVWMWKGHYDTNCFLYLFLFMATLGQNEKNIRNILHSPQRAVI